jgi:hypothetical protein
MSKRKKNQIAKPAAPVLPEPTPDEIEKQRIESRFIEIGRLNSDKEKRLRDLYFIWRNPLSAEGKKQTLRKDEIQELLDAKIIVLPKDDSAGNNGPALSDVDVCDTMEELARRMTLHFQNPDKTSKLSIEIVKATIGDWVNHRRLASTVPKFPTIQGARTRYSLRAAIEWFNNNLWHDYRRDPDQTNGAAASPFVPIGELRLVAERAELEKTLFDIEVAKGGYLATEKCAAILAGTMRQSHDFLKGLMENDSPELFELFWQGIGLTPEQITASKEFQAKEYRRIIDEVETEAARRSNENAERIQTQVKHDLGQ